MNKRHRKEDGGLTPNPVKKRKATIAAAQDAKLQMCHDILDELKSAKSEEGHFLTETFLKAPSRRTNPDYYKVIESPIDFTRIQQKVRTEEYTHVIPFADDMQLLVDNAKSYYKRTSPEFKDACELLDAFNKIRAKVEDSEEVQSIQTKPSRDTSPAVSHVSFRSNSPTRSTRSKDTSPGRFCAAGNDPVHITVLQELLASVMQLTDDTGRLLSPPFRHLPAKEELPEYFQRIKEPIDLKTIAQNIESEKYKNLNSIENDLLLMCKNAKAFNEPGSMIHKDSNTLRKFIQEKKAKLLQNAMSPLEEKIADDNRTVLKELVESTDSVDVDEYSEDSEEDEAKTSKSTDPMYKLYWALRNFTVPHLPDVTPADGFVSLPSRQCYPDYYDEVPNPISFFMINKRIKNGHYGKFEEMVKDVNIMFENAKSYNLDGSEIHKHACTLQAYGNMIAKGLDENLDLRAYPVARFGALSPNKPSTPMATSTPVLKRKRVEDPDKPRGKPGRKTMGELMSRYRNKLMEVYNAVVGYKNADGDWLAQEFMEKPLKEEYPEYYAAITNPIDLRTIKERIENDQYNSSAQLAADFDLLFDNARQFNEEESRINKNSVKLKQIFEDSSTILGPVVLDSPRHIKEKFGHRNLKMGPYLPRDSPEYFKWAKATLPAHQKRGGGASHSATCTPIGAAKKHIVGTSSEQDKMVALLDDIKNYTDMRGRRLSLIFLQLPSRKDYPDYYEVIKRPIDLQKIQARLSQRQYDNMEALVADCTLMFDNACRYNEPDSVIYKDALTLQRVLLQKKVQLRGADGSSTPNAMASVQELLQNLFITVYNHEDEEGRCYVDSMAELQDMNKKLPENKRKQFMSLDLIKRNLDKGRYLRLDRFQDDMFNTFNSARLISRSDSQLFEDATELEMFFITTRDELCKNGEYFNSPAISFTDRHLANLVDEQRMNKLPAETSEDASNSNKEDPTASPSKKKDGDTELSVIVVDEVEYKVGDFCYVQPSDQGTTEPHIIRIERLWKDSSTDQALINGNWFYKPRETFHLATRRFLQKEVFKSPFYDNVTQSRVKGKCYVMFVRDYFKYKPKGFEEKDVFVCESRYLGRVLHFKKIKIWPCADKGIELEERVEPLIAKRDISVAVVESAPSTKKVDEVEEDDTDDEEDNTTGVLDKERVEVACETPPEAPIPHCKYFEQIQIKNWWVKLGDGVLVNNVDKERPDIIRVDKIWSDKENQRFVSGQWFARPAEVEHEPCRMFYKREVFCTDKCDVTHSTNDVSGLCQVLPFKDFVAWRPTEIAEDCVFVCTTKINSSEMSMSTVDDTMSRDSVSSPPPQIASEAFSKKLTSKALKTYKLASNVLEDEVYYFRKPFQPEKVQSPLLAKLDTTVDMDNISEFAETASEFDKSEASHLKESKSWLAGQPKLTNRSKSGYILFSAEVRKKIMQDHPGCPFGEISKLVGVEWKRLSEEGKKEFEVRAQVIAEERQRVDALKPSEHSSLLPGQVRVFVCKWRDCTWQFANPELLYEHIINAHTSQIAEAGENQFVCFWATCVKYHKGGKSFPSLPRLHRHIKEKHIPSSAKNIFPHQRSKLFNPADYFPDPPSTPVPSSSPFPTTPHNTAHHVYNQSQQLISHAIPAQNSYYGQQQTQHGHVEGGIPQQAGGPGIHPPYPSPYPHHPPTHVVPHPADSGRTILDIPKDAEPVFVAPPNSQKVQRVLHSETYLRYIESLHAQPSQYTVTRFNRYLGATPRNTAIPPPEPGKPTVPLAWFGDVGNASKEDVVKALWKLRDNMMHDTFAISDTIHSMPE